MASWAAPPPFKRDFEMYSFVRRNSWTFIFVRQQFSFMISTIYLLDISGLAFLASFFFFNKCEQCGINVGPETSSVENHLECQSKVGFQSHGHDEARRRAGSGN